jgi:membrane-associated phospholipid phosphatase
MLHTIAQYTHMPKPLLVLGAFFSIYAILEMVLCIKHGYWRGVVGGLARTINNHKKIIIPALILIILCVLTVDLPITNLCKNLYNVDVYTIVDFICSMGESWFVIGVLLALGLIFRIFNQTNAALLFKISYMSAAYAGLFNLVIKIILNRQRPSIGLDHFGFFSFFLSNNKKIDDLSYAYVSMPSGHTILVVAAMLPFILYIKKPLYKAMFILFGVAVALSRVYTINHWFSDVCAGALLGTLIGISIYAINKHRLN